MIRRLEKEVKGVYHPIDRQEVFFCSPKSLPPHQQMRSPCVKPINLMIIISNYTHHIRLVLIKHDGGGLLFHFSTKAHSTLCLEVPHDNFFRSISAVEQERAKRSDRQQTHWLRISAFGRPEIGYERKRAILRVYIVLSVEYVDPSILNFVVQKKLNIYGTCKFGCLPRSQQ